MRAARTQARYSWGGMQMYWTMQALKEGSLNLADGFLSCLRSPKEVVMLSMLLSLSKGWEPVLTHGFQGWAANRGWMPMFPVCRGQFALPQTQSCSHIMNFWPVMQHTYVSGPIRIISRVLVAILVYVSMLRDVCPVMNHLLVPFLRNDPVLSNAWLYLKIIDWSTRWVARTRNQERWVGQVWTSCVYSVLALLFAMSLSCWLLSVEWSSTT